MRLDWDADTALPVSLSLLKSQLRIDHEEFDVLLSSIHMPAAVSWAEGFMHRSILAKTHRLVLEDFPRGRDQSIRLPRGKTQSVTSIAYVSNNATTTLRGPTSGSPIGTDYREDLASNSGGVLYPAYNATWPSVDTDNPSPVLITFSAGWLQSEVPGDIKNALTMYCSDALEIIGGSDMASSVDLHVKELLLTSSRLITC